MIYCIDTFALTIFVFLQEVLLWKTFQSIATHLDTAAAGTSSSEWKGDSAETTQQANHWGTMSLLNQKVVDALMQSIAENGSEVKL